LRRFWRGNRLVLLFISLFLCTGIILTSVSGTLAPVEGVAAIPLNLLAGLFSNITRGGNNLVEDVTEIQNLRSRVEELEEALAQLQPEIVELREINSDYQRLVDLLDYSSAALNQETVAAEVISYDPNAALRTIVINRGARDGIQRGMPVVTGAGLVGRVTDVFANASRVLLVTDPSSAVSARLQNTREQGSVIGLLSGNLRMEMLPLNADVQIGDIVITSGLGGNFPSDIPIGQVESTRQFEFELNQTAEIRSLVDFDSLEFVLIVTSFQPIDVSVFDVEDAT